MSDIPPQYRDMLRAALRGERIPQETVNDDRPLKRRRKPGQKTVLSPVQRQRELKKQPRIVESDKPKYVVHLGEDFEDNEDKNADIENKTRRKSLPSEKNHKIIESDGNDKIHTEKQPEFEDDEDLDSDEFEDVDLDGTSFHDEEAQDDAADNHELNEDINEEINITITPHRTVAKKQRVTVVETEERMFRKKLHIMHLFMMVGHGAFRNKWLSDPELLKLLQKQIPVNIKREVQAYIQHRTKTNVTAQSNTRRLLDLLRHLMEFWQKIWVTDSKAPVMYKKTWADIAHPNSIKPQKRQTMSFVRFRKALIQHVGSRDIAAQGFVALLRSINLPARLVFSIQSPDFTNMKKFDPIAEGEENTEDVKEVNHVIKRLKTSDRLLSVLRGRKPYTNTVIKTQAQTESEFEEKYGAWPVFWTEVWDKDSKKYITIDPMVKKLIEVVNWKSKLEPPMNCVRNNSWYVVGYDRIGGVRDITRRYCKEYNAKGRKKRITREPKWETWWHNCIRGACSKQRVKDNRVDKFEQIEFEELGLKEGMPLNVGDFKGHPVYVLESDLKFNEILMPKISCGGLANKSKSKKAKNGFIPVYKRSNVCVVRSARGWFMRGRVLKIGERPVKIREKKVKRGAKKTEDDFELSEGEGVEHDDDTRLYAESQTELYKPPPVLNGVISKNAYKNIDIYQPWMIPSGCVHVKHKLAEKAAKMMGIEYANAVVGFDFKGRRDVSARIEGIVTLEEYGDAVALLCEGLKDMEDDNERRKKDLINLRAWSLLLTKLKINKRLLLAHGEVEDDEESGEESEREEELESGGFVVSKNTASSRTRSHSTMQGDNIGMIDEDIDIDNAYSDLSATDFESDADVDGGGFEIENNSKSGGDVARGYKTSRSNYEESYKRTEMNSQSESVLELGTNITETTTNLVGNDGELVYNPNDDEFDYYDSSESMNDSEVENSDNGDGDYKDYRIDELDADFVEFEKELDGSD